MEQVQELSEFNPLAATLLVVVLWLVWRLPGRFAVCPLFIMICLVPLGQQVVLFGLHFHFFRIVLAVGALRVLAKGEWARLVLNRTDKVFIWWAVVTVFFGTMAKPSPELFVNRLGDAYNAIGCYLFVRCVLSDFEDIRVTIKALAWLSMALALLMVVEKATTHNLLSIFGGVPEITSVRGGHLRCQGAFRHPILAGCFGAAGIPLFSALWFGPHRNRFLAVAGIASGLTIAVTASSSGALMAVLAACAGLLLWRWRYRLRALRWGAVTALLGLALLMNAPVWYLFVRLSNVAGGEGWHRAWLIDQTVAHFDEWWLFGTVYTAHWGPAGEVIAADPDMMDITNHYVMEGVKGGVLKLGLFIIIIIRSFADVGAWIRAEVAGSHNQFLGWALGVSFFVHCLSFLSVTYFDQSIIVWYWLAACISSWATLLAPPAARAGLAEDSSPEREPEPAALQGTLLKLLRPAQHSL
jgi:hypothetical protein